MTWLRTYLVLAMAVAAGWCCVGHADPAPATHAGDARLYDDGELTAWARVAVLGVTEAAVPTKYNGVERGSFQAIEVSDRVSNLDSWPVTLVDLIANAFIRLSYQRADGKTGELGTSVAGSFAYRTTDGLQYTPSGVSAAVTIGGESDRLRIVRDGRFGEDATVCATCTFPDPPIGHSTLGLTTRFEARQSIDLDPALRGNDAFRLVGMSSMFANPREYDADTVRWLGPDGVGHELPLTAATARDVHLFPEPVEIAVGGYFELVKHAGSSWFPTSPSVRIELLELSGITGRVGVQGWLAPTTDPTDDSLTIWLEWIDAPAVIPAGAVYEARLRVIATPPRSR